MISKIWDFIKNKFTLLLDSVFPLRSDFSIVKNLSEQKIISLPKSSPVYGENWIHPLFQYKNRTVKAIIWELKYREIFYSLDTISRLIFDEMVEKMSEVLLFDSDAKFLLIPIPISTARRIERGYNQSEILAKSILENDTSHYLLYAPQWFSKIRETPTQSHSHSKKERQQNLNGCFEANPNVSGFYVFLVDDVVTTGSTLSEARQTLLETGAKNVWAYTIAH